MEPRTTAIEPRKPSAAAKRVIRNFAGEGNHSCWFDCDSSEVLELVVDDVTGIPEAIEALDNLIHYFRGLIDWLPDTLAKDILTKAEAALAKLKGGDEQSVQD